MNLLSEFQKISQPPQLSSYYVSFKQEIQQTQGAAQQTVQDAQQAAQQIVQVAQESQQSAQDTNAELLKELRTEPGMETAVLDPKVWSFPTQKEAAQFLIDNNILSIYKPPQWDKLADVGIYQKEVGVIEAQYDTQSSADYSISKHGLTNFLAKGAGAVGDIAGAGAEGAMEGTASGAIKGIAKGFGVEPQTLLIGSAGLIVLLVFGRTFIMGYLKKPKKRGPSMKRVQKMIAAATRSET